MARIDVSEVLLDADFIDPLMCERFEQVVGDNGIATSAKTEVPFVGVITASRGDEMQRAPHSERVGGSILVITKFVLQAGRAESNDHGALIADVVRRVDGRRYTVTNVNDYSHYGRGFVAAECDLIPLSG